jgi:biotin synthase-related radical SAM superfamily protein
MSTTITGTSRIIKEEAEGFIKAEATMEDVVADVDVVDVAEEAMTATKVDTKAIKASNSNNSSIIMLLLLLLKIMAKQVLKISIILGYLKDFHQRQQ